MKLVKLTKENYPLVVEMLDEWTNVEKDITPWAIVRSDYHDFENYKVSLENGFKPIDESTFFLYDEVENIMLGAINIRHDLSELMLLKTGHIGYGIRPSMRGKGYGPTQLNLALIESKKLGLSKVLLVCDPNNLASKRTIIVCGGVFENEITYNEHQYQRYWITL